MGLSVRARFEVFKRDDFTCQYCGRKSPEVVLEVDHIVPRAGGGSDDVINLRTSCWECNSGKSDKPLSEIVTGEDPYDRAVLLLEKERQLREYNAVLAAIAARVEDDLEQIRAHWALTWPKRELRLADVNWLRHALTQYPVEFIKHAMDIALERGCLGDMRYTAGILKSWREQGKV